MSTVEDIAAAIARIAPPSLAEEWDNTGLLLGDRSATVRKAMTCLTVTPESAAESVDDGAQLIVSHHPLPFRPVARITTDTRDGALLWRLAGAGVAIYSPHTSFDSASEGVNQQLAQRLALTPEGPLAASPGNPAAGAGRIAIASPATTLAKLADRLKASFGLSSLRVAGPRNGAIARVGCACGSGGSLLDDAIAARCDALVTGEANFHTCLAAEAAGLTLLLVGHYHSERFAVEWLAERLASDISDVRFWASRHEKDPLRAL